MVIQELITWYQDKRVDRDTGEIKSKLEQHREISPLAAQPDIEIFKSLNNVSYKMPPLVMATSNCLYLKILIL